MASKKKLETELKRGFANFKAWGTIKVGEDTFPEPVVSERSTYKYVNARMSLGISEGRLVYVQMMGGYDPAKPILKRFSKDPEAGMMDIKWDFRKDKKIIDEVANNSLIRVSVKKDEDGKLIKEVFLSELDAVEYLRDNLEDGTEVCVTGNVEYSRYNDKIQRNLNVRGVFLNEGYTKSDGTKVEPHKHEAELKQTYLIDYTGLSSRYLHELEKDGKTTISGWVPQYIGKENGVEIRKVLPLEQQFSIEANEDNVDLRKKMIDKLFKVKDKKVVREVAVRNNIVEGYDQAQGEIEISDELQDLIDNGLMSEDDIKKEITVRGNRISELLFAAPVIARDEDQKASLVLNDKYSPEVLSVPDEDEEDMVEDEDENSQAEGDELTKGDIDDLFK